MVNLQADQKMIKKTGIACFFCYNFKKDKILCKEIININVVLVKGDKYGGY